ncbi:SMI1/KNR4 family protein [Streptomyces sp. MnatMP-M17]|uniref:SMI1/KNR4 family protein n=1 Tax=unclassified Streptomyces TaxID=2593676 RepID=UPI00159F0083|nr:SMI1/KNR4 family protein [Streptomyces sp. MnatMP-M17]
MIVADDRQLLPALAAVADVPFHYAEDAADFEPFPAFLSAEETTEWLRAWTRNGEVDGDEFRVFGQDGTGGYAAIWLTRPDRPLADQPVVFLGSEGEAGVIAADLAGFLWLLADGLGPREAVDSPGQKLCPDAALSAIAERFAPGFRRPASAVIDAAAREFPDFEATVVALCR